MTSSNVTPMAEPVKPDARTAAQWLAEQIRHRYPEIDAHGDLLSVPIIRPDRVAFLALELTQPSPWILVCHEPIVWQAYRALDPDTFNMIVDAFGLEDDRDNETIHSPAIFYLNHKCADWFDTFVRGLTCLIWTAEAMQRNRAYLDGAFYRAAEELYELECSFTKSLTAKRFHELTADEQDLYRDATKAALCGRIGHTNAKAFYGAVRGGKIERLRGLDPFVIDTASTYARECLSRLDEERVRVITEQIKGAK